MVKFKYPLNISIYVGMEEGFFSNFDFSYLLPIFPSPKIIKKLN